MHQERFFAYGEDEDLQLLWIPYQERALSMVVLLPKKADGEGGGLAALEKKLTADNLNRWFKNIGVAKVDVTLPKFTFSSRFYLGKNLAAMGMPDAFNGSKADFSGMTTAEHLYIGEAIHQAFVVVDEEGTEAAAATAVMLVGAARPKPEEPRVFKADHPFIFLIRHNATGEILFLGRVVNPKSE